MPDKKPWTVMVYFAADNNLENFGVDSLRQMKIAARDTINVVAEFDVGPTKRNRRFAFNGQDPFGDIKQDVKQRFGPTNAADPDNLVNFIEWGAKEFPAERYFVIIWGHGGGIDDDFPNAADNSFVPRHKLLSLFDVNGAPATLLNDNSKGVLDDPLHGVLDDPIHGVLDDPIHGVLDDPVHGIFANHPTGVLCDQINGVMDGPLNSLMDVLKIGDEALHRAAFDALKDGIRLALGKRVLNEIKRSGLDISGKRPLGSKQTQRLAELQKGLIQALKDGALTTLETGALGTARQRILLALRQGILNALQTGLIVELQTSVLEAVRKGNPEAAVKRIHHAVGKTILRCLENGIVEILQMGVLNVAPRSRQVKSVAFVDHPTSFLTNADLQDALTTASQRIGQNIDVLAMDSCNMNMIEIGYGLRNSVNFMVASQDGIPDASLPYDKIIAQLVSHPDIKPKELASLTASIFLAAYNDYSPKPRVTLSVLDLKRSGEIVPFFRNFAASLRKASADFSGRSAIANARRQVRSFGANQFIDLVQFCSILSAAPDLDLARDASNLIAPLRAMISENKPSRNEPDCNGTSIYLPLFDPQQIDHEERLGRLYNHLEFVKATTWGQFITDFLKSGKEESVANQALVSATSKSKPHSKRKTASRTSRATTSHLSKAAKTAKAVASELINAAHISETNGSALNGVTHVVNAVATEVEALVTASKNGGLVAGQNGHNGKH